MVIGIFLLGSVQLFFIGLLGEYILNINTRVIHRPLVVEEKRLNFDTMRAKQEDVCMSDQMDGSMDKGSCLDKNGRRQNKPEI